MTQFLTSIPGNIVGACYGIKNTLGMAYDKLTTTTPWTKTASVVSPIFQGAVDYCPEAIKFSFSKDYAAGAITVVALGATANAVNNWRTP